MVNLNIQEFSLFKADRVQLTRLSNVACLVLKVWRAKLRFLLDPKFWPEDDCCTCARSAQNIYCMHKDAHYYLNNLRQVQAHLFHHAQCDNLGAILSF
jgi:hypothetical protein